MEDLIDRAMKLQKSQKTDLQVAVEVLRLQELRD
jgi:hypothetical protein